MHSARYSGCVVWRTPPHSPDIMWPGIETPRCDDTLVTSRGILYVCVAAWPDWLVACLAKRNYIAKDSKEGRRSLWSLEAFPTRGWEPPREPVFRKHAERGIRVQHGFKALLESITVTGPCSCLHLYTAFPWSKRPSPSPRP